MEVRIEVSQNFDQEHATEEAPAPSQVFRDSELKVDEKILQAKDPTQAHFLRCN